MPFSIEIMPSGLQELKAIRIFHRRQIVQAIEDLLTHQPAVETRNRKLLGAPTTSFDSEPPIWELRVGAYRVFYDVDEVAAIVSVRAVREKPPHTTTEEIL